MGLYDVLADEYERLFPTDPARVEFCRSFLAETGGVVLDAGCGTGQLCRELARYGHRVIGLDLDPAMIAKGRRRAAEEGVAVELDVAGMLDTGTVAKADSLDLLTCLGNTLVHLSSDADVDTFFDLACSRLREDGSFVVQILNYDRIMQERPQRLPTIETGRYRFERRYTYRTDAIAFTGTLVDSTRRESWTGEALIRPIRRAGVEASLASRFRTVRCLAEFDGTPADPTSFVLTFVAEHPAAG